MILIFDGQSFNRYMVECEYVIIDEMEFADGVLIDTWWNVNLLDLRTLPEAEIRFNRYMVECES